MLKKRTTNCGNLGLSVVETRLGASYIVRAKGDLWEAKARFWDDLMWMDQLPNHIVLDDVRLVHAGYDPRMPPDAQGDKEMLLIRKRFYEHHSPIDPNRTILFGHSTTTKAGPCPGQVAASNMTLDDGRPAWIAMDVGAFNHVSPGIAAINIDTLEVVKQTTLRSERWFDLPTRRESAVGEHWGLSVLKTERRKEMTKQLRKRRQLRMAGVVLQSEEAIMATANEPRHIQKIVAKMDWSEQFGPTQRTLQLGETTRSVKMHDDSSLEHLKPGDYTDGFYSDVLKFAQMDGRQEAEIVSCMVQVTAKKRDNMEFKDQTTSRSMPEDSMELKLSNHRNEERFLNNFSTQA